MGTALYFLEEARAAFMAHQLVAAGQGVLWNPKDRPDVVRTSATKTECKKISDASKGKSIEDWFNLPGIDVNKK